MTTGESDDSKAIEFLLEEYRDLYQNVMHIESKLFNHLSVFTTLFLGLVTASIAILQLVDEGLIPKGGADVLASLTLPFLLLFAVGRFELRMITELRIRKVKFIEGIVKIREYFVGLYGAISDYLVLPTTLERAPLYLRVGSQDWYQILYFCLLNSVSLLTAWLLPAWLIATLLLDTLDGYIKGWVVLAVFIPTWVAVGVCLAFGLIFWKLSYENTMAFCKEYDRRREKQTGRKNEYDLLERPLPPSRLYWTFSDWVRHLDERKGSYGGRT